MRRDKTTEVDDNVDMTLVDIDLVNYKTQSLKSKKIHKLNLMSPMSSTNYN